MVILISYELRQPGRDYSNLYKAIEGISGIWSHPLTSHWMVQTALSPQQVWEHLAPHIDKNDSMLVTRISNSPSYSGWLAQTIWNWMAARAY